MNDCVILLDANDPDNIRPLEDDSGKVKVFFDEPEARSWISENLVCDWNASVWKLRD